MDDITRLTDLSQVTVNRAFKLQRSGDAIPRGRGFG